METQKKAKKILVVDDDPEILTLIQRILVKDGHQVFTATNGTAAISLGQQQTFDLILLDIMMPGVDGFEVCRSIQRDQQGKRTPVVFVTAREDSAAMRDGFRAGGTVFLSKPFTATQLLRIVHTMTDK
jgi:CheY-like chemotaxis protein